MNRSAIDILLILLAVSTVITLLPLKAEGHQRSEANCNEPHTNIVCSIDILGESPPYFAPQNITVLRNAKAIWVNHDQTSPHTVTLTDSQFTDQSPRPNGKYDAGFIQPNQQAPEFNFTSPGEYRYYCRLHPWMRGKVTVSPIDTHGNIQAETVTVTRTQTATVTQIQTSTTTSTLTQQTTATQRETLTVTQTLGQPTGTGQQAVTTTITATQTIRETAPLAAEGTLTIGAIALAAAIVATALLLRRRR